MPELPDVCVYVEALRRRVERARLDSVVIRGPFVLRTVEPPVDACEGRRVVGVSRLGKRVVIELEGQHFLVIHLMIAGRLKWAPGAKLPGGKIDLAAFRFGAAEGEGSPAAPGGTLVLTEAGTTKRASLHVVGSRDGLAEHHAGGVDVLEASEVEFAAALRRTARTLKRALTDPRTCDGIGNAYSDEILHAARMSPFKRTDGLTDEEVVRLRGACLSVLETWTARLMREFRLDRPGAGKFPGAGEITAFREDFAVHGRYRQPCPVCGRPVQRIVFSEREFNYCAQCQTEGRVLSDRSLARLLRSDWPARIEEWE